MLLTKFKIKKKSSNKIEQSKLIKSEKFLDIPSNTLKLIEEAEKGSKLKFESE